MGSCQPKPYQNGFWQELSPGVLRNYQTYEQIEIHSHKFESTEAQEDFVEAYELRRTPVPPFVRVLDYRFEKSFIWGNPVAFAYTEHIYRLRDLELSIPQATYMLRECIIAYSLLFEQYGPFLIKNNMIGVNQQGRVKVWISDNFSENDLKDPGNIPDYITEQDIVLDLARLIEDQLDADHLTTFLMSYYGKLNFQNALKIIDITQSHELVKVNRVFLNEEEYNRYLTKQLLTSDVASTGEATSATAQITTTTTTKTTTTQMIPLVHPQPPAHPQSSPINFMALSKYQASRLIVMPEPHYINDIGSAHTYQAMMPATSAFVLYEVPKALVPYQKMSPGNLRPRREQPVRIINRPSTSPNELIKPIRRVQRQRNLQRVMPTTEKNTKQKELQHQHREKFKAIPMVESRIVKAANNNMGNCRQNYNVTESFILEGMRSPL